MPVPFDYPWSHAVVGPVRSAYALFGDAGGWNRRQRVLAACFAAAVALTALAVPLKLLWLVVAGVVAAVSAVAGLVISIERARLESKRERAELARRVKVPVAPITEINPTLIGVDPAATQTLGGTEPEYVGREIDAELRGAIEAALTGAGSWMLIPRTAAPARWCQPRCQRSP